MPKGSVAVSAVAIRSFAVWHVRMSTCTKRHKANLAVIFIVLALNNKTSLLANRML